MSRVIWSTLCSLLFCWNVGHAAMLEIPNHHGIVSGIGVISGWKCEVNGDLTIRFNGGPALPLLYGSARPDTHQVCGDVNNGFVAIWNWGNLSEGTHTAVIYEDGVEFDRATFDVVTYKTEFLRGVSGTCEVQDFPYRGDVTTLVWEQATQHFELADVWTEEEEEESVNPPTTDAQRLAQECPLWGTTEIGTQTGDYIQNCLDLGASHTPPGEQVHPLHVVVQQDNLSAARVLLQAGANPNATHVAQPPALHHAVSDMGSIAMIQLLLAHGADPNIPSQRWFDYGSTATHEAIAYWVIHWQEGVVAVLDDLIEAGANMNVFTARGDTPLHLAVHESDRVSRGPALQLSTENWNSIRSVFQTLLDAGANINAQGPIPQDLDREREVFGTPLSVYGQTALYDAFQSQAPYFEGGEEVTFLLDAGADPNLQTHGLRLRKVQNGLTDTYVEVLVPDKTPFLYAMSGGNATNNRTSLRLVQQFLAADADPDIADADGLTALFYVFRGVRAEQEDIERALITAGADPTHTFTRDDGQVVSYTCLTDECQAVQDAG